MKYGWLDILMCLWILAYLKTRRSPRPLEDKTATTENSINTRASVLSDFFFLSFKETPYLSLKF